MGNNKKDRRPTVMNLPVPVYIPTEGGDVEVEVGEARLRAGTLVVEFKDTMPAVAIQRMFDRGSVLGLAFVMVAPDEANARAQQQLQAVEEAKAAEDQLDIPEEPTEDEAAQDVAEEKENS